MLHRHTYGRVLRSTNRRRKAVCCAAVSVAALVFSSNVALAGTHVERPSRADASPSALSLTAAPQDPYRADGLQLPGAAWPSGSPSLVDRVITPADADTESVFRKGTVFHRITYAAAGMLSGYYQVDTGPYDTVWLGSIYGTPTQASAMATDVETNLRSRGAAVDVVTPCLPQAPTCSWFSFMGTSSTGTSQIAYAVWSDGSVLGELMIKAPPGDTAATISRFSSVLALAVAQVHGFVGIEPTSTPTASPAPTALPGATRGPRASISRTPTPAKTAVVVTPTVTASPTPTSPPPSVSIASVALLHTLHGHVRATRTLHTGEAYRLLVSYRNLDGSHGTTTATVQLGRKGKPLGYPVTLPLHTTLAGTAARELVTRTSTIAGGWVAHFTVTRGLTSVTRNLSFTVAKR